MSTEGIQAVFLETHNWGRSAKFFQALGFKVDLETDHNSGMLRNGDGAYLFIAEIPEDQQPQQQIALAVPDESTCRLDPVVEVVTGWADTHYGSRQMTVRDPDGRVWNLQAPGSK